MFGRIAASGKQSVIKGQRSRTGIDLYTQKRQIYFPASYSVEKKNIIVNLSHRCHLTGKRANSWGAFTAETISAYIVVWK
jgi:hypothetical protein